MMHRAWSSIVEVPYCFSRSYIKFQGHTALKIVEFDPNWAFPDSNSSLNSPMAMKCCTKLETAKERCPIVFQGHPSNFKVTRDKTSPILTQIGSFRTIGRSQLSNPSDLPCFISFPTARRSEVIPRGTQISWLGTTIHNFLLNVKKNPSHASQKNATGQHRHCHAVVSSWAIEHFEYQKLASLWPASVIGKVNKWSC